MSELPVKQPKEHVHDIYPHQAATMRLQLGTSRLKVPHIVIRLLCRKEECQYEEYALEEAVELDWDE